VISFVIIQNFWPYIKYLKKKPSEKERMKEENQKKSKT